jgi:hypothetical protein
MVERLVRRNEEEGKPVKIKIKKKKVEMLHLQGKKTEIQVPNS